MFFTGFTRYSAKIQSVNLAAKEEKIPYLLEMLQLVDEAEKVLTDKYTNLDDFGRLLDATWKMKRNTGKCVTTDSIDDIYQRSIRAGAIGGKLLGAGGGGFFVFYVPLECQDNVKRALNELLYIPFEFEDGGTQVIHYTPEHYDPELA